MNWPIAAAFIALAIGFVVMASVLGWQIIRGDTRADQLIEERAAHQTTRAKLERREFELKHASDALLAANRRIATLSAAAEKRIDEPVNADLAPGDVHARRVRAAVKAKAAAARGASAVPAEPAAPVRAETDPAEPVAAAVPGRLDTNEVLR